jgi:hypothetical protein
MFHVEQREERTEKGKNRILTGFLEGHFKLPCAAFQLRRDFFFCDGIKNRKSIDSTLR